MTTPNNEIAKTGDERIALRPDSSGMLDDVVVRDVEMFRAEMMDNRSLWMCCYFEDSAERITFYVRAKGGRLIFEVMETPRESEAFDYELVPNA